MIGYWPWLYYLERKWQPPDEIVINSEPQRVDVWKVVGFAICLATFGTDGANCHPSADTLARRGNCSERTAKRLRGLCVALGIFRLTGWYRTDNGKFIPNLEISLPPGVDAGEIAEEADVRWDPDEEDELDWLDKRIAGREPRPVHGTWDEMG